jgi:hypothetical protein
MATETALGSCDQTVQYTDEIPLYSWPATWPDPPAKPDAFKTHELDRPEEPSLHLRVLSSVCYFICPAILYLAHMVERETLGLPSVLAVSGWTVAVGVPSTIALEAQRAYRRQQQRSRNWAATSRALKIWHDITVETPRPLALYLRPFFITQRLAVDNVHYVSNPLATAHYEEPRRKDIELVLEDALDRFDVLALGQQGEIGVARIEVTEAEWKQRIAALALRAHLIVAIPSGRPGTRWEMGWLVENHRLSKSLLKNPSV